jgi:hypothetical protein
MLLVAILSGQDSLLGMERFAKRHRKTLNQLLGTHTLQRHQIRDAPATS